MSALHSKRPTPASSLMSKISLRTPRLAAADIADRLNIPVMTYGLRTDFQGKLFPASKELLAIADELREIRTICHCGRKATMVARFDNEGKVVTEGAQIEVGGNEKYVSFCRRHWWRR